MPGMNDNHRPSSRNKTIHGSPCPVIALVRDPEFMVIQHPASKGARATAVPHATNSRDRGGRPATWLRHPTSPSLDGSFARVTLALSFISSREPFARTPGTRVAMDHGDGRPPGNLQYVISAWELLVERTDMAIKTRPSCDLSSILSFFFPQPNKPTLQSCLLLDSF